MPTPTKVIVSPPAVNMFSSLLQNPIQSPPVFIGAIANMNQTFHTSAEPSPESSKSAANIRTLPPWDAQSPSTPTPTSQWNSAYAKVQAASSDVPKAEETPLLLQYNHSPVFPPSGN